MHKLLFIAIVVFLLTSCQEGAFYERNSVIPGQLWDNGNKPELKIQDNTISKGNGIENLPQKDLFEFLSPEHSPNTDLGLFSLLPDAQGEDYEEEQFANQMKKKQYPRKRRH